jgi:small subunit ribosomal protein S20
MPVIKSAKKKLRQDIKKEKINRILKESLRSAIKDAKKAKTSEKVSKAVKLIDKAVKNRFIHKNKAARIKSSLSKLVKSTNAKPKTTVKTAKKTKTSKAKK